MKSNFSNKRMTLEPCVKLEDEEIHMSGSFRYLGSIPQKEKLTRM